MQGQTGHHMTRRHFKALAESVRFLDVNHETRFVVARALAAVCRRFNSRFSEYRWYTACGVVTVYVSGNHKGKA